MFIIAIFDNSLNLSNVGGVIKRDRQICDWGFNNNNNKGLYCIFKQKNTS